MHCETCIVTKLIDAMHQLEIGAQVAYERAYFGPDDLKQVEEEITTAETMKAQHRTLERKLQSLNPCPTCSHIPLTNTESV